MCIFLTSTKMIKISPEKYEQNGIEILFNNFGRLWLNEKHIENTIAHSALQNINILQNIENKDKN